VTEQQRPLARHSQGQFEMASDRRQPADLADILERVLDKGIVIAGDIKVNLLEVELLTIKIRLLVASVDKAKEMGIDWWENDPLLSTRARGQELEEENQELKERLKELESGSGSGSGSKS
jgi:hypothetical protein